MNPEESAFLKGILENPADDTVRLVYADWLDENGSTRMASQSGPSSSGYRSRCTTPTPPVSSTDENKRNLFLLRSKPLTESLSS